MKRPLFLLLLFVFFLQNTFLQAQTIRFVKNIPGLYELEDHCNVDWFIYYYYHKTQGGDFSLYASCWYTASHDLQLVIDMSEPGDEIWVAGGVYTPRIRADLVEHIAVPQDEWSLIERFFKNCHFHPLDRGSAFVLKPGVRIYGGFGGWEESLCQRDLGPSFCTSSILNGFLPNGEQLYHVVISAGCGESTVLDGFTIRGGRADGHSNDLTDYMTVRGQTIFHHSGGGIYSANSATIFTNLLVEDNYAFLNGGGIYESNGSSSFIGNSIIRNNTAGFGGGIYFNGWGYFHGFYGLFPVQTVLNTVLINGNTANYRGGGIYVAASEPTIVNATIVHNTVWGASGGGGIYNDHLYCAHHWFQSTLRLFNTVVWGNTAPHQGSFSHGQDRNNIFRHEDTIIEYSHCLIEGWWHWGNWEFGYDITGTTFDDENFSLETNYIWECVNNSDGSISYRGFYSGANMSLMDMGSDYYYWNQGRGYLIFQFCELCHETGLECVGENVELNFHPRFNGTIDIGAYEVP